MIIKNILASDVEAQRRLLRRLHPDELRAWEEYNKLRQKLVMFFEPRFDAPELAEEALDRIARKPESCEITNVAEFAFGVARNLRKEIFHKSSSAVCLANEQLTAKYRNPETEFLYSSELSYRRECFRRCLNQLAPNDRQLIQEYYPSDDEDLENRRQRLAESVGMSWGALRTRVIRLRNRLAKCCTKCYVQDGGSSKFGKLT